MSLSRGVRILNAILYASDGLILVMAMHYTFLTRKVPASVNETSTVAPGDISLYLYLLVCARLAGSITKTDQKRSDHVG